jgi:hypothetical protein
MDEEDEILAREIEEAKRLQRKHPNARIYLCQLPSNSAGILRSLTSVSSPIQGKERRGDGEAGGGGAAERRGDA